MKTACKVLFLARWYPDRYDPMMGLFIKRHAEVAAGFSDVSVLYLRAVPEKPFGVLIEQKVENGVNTNLVYYGTKSAWPRPLAKLFAAYAFVAAFIKGYRFILDTWGKPDIIHVNVLTRLGIFALWLRWFKGRKYVITEHWSRYLPVTGTYKGVLRRFITKMVVSNAAAVSTVSENLAHAMQGHGLAHKHYLVLPNVVDSEVYVPAAGSLQRKIKRLVHISCFEDRSKNISGILRTLSELVKVRNDFECIMVGEGIDLEKMKSYAAELGLHEPRLRFTGLLEDENLVDIYQSANFMVMFSNYENMPVVISESFCCGLPVLATAVGGIPEYINAGNGRLVSARNEKALFEGLCFLLDHCHEFDKDKIRQDAVAVFSKQAVADKLKELYSYCEIL